MSHDDRAPDKLEREIEETRERLAATIDELIHRSSPKTIARRELDALKGQFVDPQGNPRTDNILKVVGGVAGFVVLLVVIRKVSS